MSPSRLPTLRPAAFDLHTLLVLCSSSCKKSLRTWSYSFGKVKCFFNLFGEHSLPSRVSLYLSWSFESLPASSPDSFIQNRKNFLHILKPLFLFSVNELSGKAMLKFTRHPFTHWFFTFYSDPVLQLLVESQFQGRSWPQINTIIANQVLYTSIVSLLLLLLF